MKTIRVPVLVVICVLLFCTCKQNNKIIDPINKSSFDRSFKPGNDFYSYINNLWIKNNPVPEDKPNRDQFEELFEKNNLKVKQLVDELIVKPQEKGTISQMISDFYTSGMDSNTIEILGIKPLQDEFKRIDLIKNSQEFIEELARLHSHLIFPFFKIYADQDPKNSIREIIFLSQAGLGMTDRDYYLDKGVRSEQLRKEYRNYISNMFKLFGDSPKEATDNAENILLIETKLAGSSMSRVDLRDPFKIFNKMDIGQLQRLSNGFDWTYYFNKLGIDNPGIINVMQPGFFNKMVDVMYEFSLDNCKTYLRWCFMNSMAKYLNRDIANENFNFYDKVMNGTQKMPPRWKRILWYTNDALDMALGKIYVEKYFSSKDKERMLQLVDFIKSSFETRIKNLKWMSDSTKNKAIEKLLAIKVKIGYPDTWRDYEGLQINRSSFAGNVLNCDSFKMRFIIRKINKPVDPQEWSIPPQTINAFYNPTLNDICFPAAILQPPFFYDDADDAINYGAIGVVIGHELTHGFDDEGRFYDKVGNLNEWWTKSDAANFNKRVQVLVDQYNNITVRDSLKANGKLTLGENIADLGGLNISFQALKNAMKEKFDTTKIGGLSSAQRFFISYARIWAENLRDKTIIKKTKEDVHSIGRSRVNGPLRNIPEFYSAFNVQPGDSMYLPENKRAIIW